MDERSFLEMRKGLEMQFKHMIYNFFTLLEILIFFKDLKLMMVQISASCMSIGTETPKI